MRFLFWNVGKKSVIQEITQIVKNREIDIIALAEFNENPNDLLRSLYSESLDFYLIPRFGCYRITILSNMSPGHFKPGGETEYYTIKEIYTPARDKVLIVFVHFPSKMFMSQDDQMDETRLFIREVEQAEREFKNNNTLIVGDFNMNPFDRGMVAASGIHSIPCSLTVKQRQQRKVKGRNYTMFYNPMWNLLGDKDNKPGTYYYSAAEHLIYFWNILDQVIIRPGLIDRFDIESLEIITRDNNISLVNDKHRPCLSDHLPIVFAFK